MHKRAVAFHDDRPDVVGEIALAADDDRPAIAKRCVHGERALQFQHHGKNVTALGFAIFAYCVVCRIRTPSKGAERRRWATAAPLG